MSQPFDPYHLWLSIPPNERPANHYRLLGLQLFESDVEVIRDAAERQLGHLRRYPAGSAGGLAEHLIAEVTRAQEELLNPTTKQSYDSQLRGRNPVEVGFLVQEGSKRSVGVSADLMVRLTGHGFDPLYHWLGIPAREQPPTLYRLLGLPPFESHVDVIREGAERQIAHIRKYSLGERRAIAETLLRVLVEARGQLLDGVRKQAYDQRLRQLGSVVRRYASGAIELQSSRPPETTPLTQLDPIPDAGAVSDPFQLDEFEAIPLPPVRALPARTRRRRRTPLPAWLPYAVGGGVVVALLLVLLGAAYLFITRGSSETVAVIPVPPPVDVPQLPTIHSTNVSPPVTPQDANRIELEPPRKGNPLLDYHRLSSRLEEAGVDAVLDEYRDSSDADVQLVTKALDLSKYVLREDPSQLWSQLQARTVQAGGVPLSNFGQLRPTQPYWECLTASFSQAGGPLLQTFTARPRPPLQFTSDGRRIVTRSHEDRLNRLDVWDLKTGKRLTTFSGHKDHVQTFAITPDGRTVVSASTGLLKAWELETGKELRTLTLPRVNIHTLAITPDGKTVVSGSEIDFGKVVPIRAWDLETGAESRSFGQGLDLDAVAMTPDGRKVLAVWRKELKTWDLASGKELYTFERRSNPHTLAVSPDSRLVASEVGFDLKLWKMRVWDLESGREVSTLTGLDKPCRAMAFTADGSQLVTSSFDETVKVWDVQSGDLRMTLTGHLNAGAAIAISPDAQTIVTASLDRTLLMSSLKTGIGPIALGRTYGSNNAIVFAPDNRRFATINDGKEINIWETAGASQPELLPDLPQHGPVAISPDGREFAYIAEDRTSRERVLQLWDVDTGLRFRTQDGFEGRTDQLAFSPDGRTILSSFFHPIHGRDPVKLWTLDGQQRATLDGHDSSAHRVAYTADESKLVSAGNDGTLTVWDLDGNELQTLRGHSDRVHSVMIAPDDQTLVSASQDAAIKVWDLQTGQQRSSLSASKPVYGAMATPDGKSVVANVSNETLQVWDLESGTRRQTFAQHIGPFLLTPNGQAIVSYDGMLVTVRDLQTGRIQMTVPTESRIAAFRLLPDGQTLIVVESSGKIHRLRLHGI